MTPIDQIDAAMRHQGTLSESHLYDALRHYLDDVAFGKGPLWNMFSFGGMAVSPSEAGITAQMEAVMGVGGVV